MNSFGHPKKKVLSIQFSSSVTQGSRLFIFDLQSERGLVNSVPFVCLVVPYSSSKITE